MSPAVPDGPPTPVVFMRGGAQVAMALVPGHVLEFALPPSVRTSRHRDRVEILEDPDPLLECCGELQIPYLGQRGPGVVVLDVPPPAPFSAADLTTMWQARNRITAKRRPETSGSAEWSQLAERLGPEVNWPALQDAVISASRLLAMWPQSSVPDVTWKPVDRPGGRELVSVTERARRSHRLPPVPSGSPANTARRRIVSKDRRLTSLAAISSLLATSLEELPGLEAEPQVRERLIGLFHRVARRSQARRAVADPPPSTWPDMFGAAYSSCMKALSVARNIGPGEQKAALSEVWELYQAWVADVVLQGMRAELGPEAKSVASRTCLGEWTDDGASVQLHYQARIPAVGSFSALGHELVAAVGDLAPDLLVIRSSNSSSRFVALDAKKRSDVVSTEDLTVNASKYLWGIRRRDALGDVPVLQSCVLVSPLGGPISARPEGRASVVTGHPTSGIAADLVGNMLTLLRA